MWTVAELKSELKETFSRGIPAIISSLSDFFMYAANTAFMGHIGSEELAAASLGLSWAFCTFYLVIGLSYAMDTFVTQAKGANNNKLIGYTLQQTVVVMITASIPIGVLWAATSPIFKLAGIDPKMAEMAGKFNLIQLPGLLPATLYFAFVKYLQTQGQFKQPAIVAIFISAINVGFNYFFMYGIFGFKGIGIYGSAIAIACSKFLYFIVMWIVLVKNPYHKVTWTGWSFEAINPKLLAKFLKIGIPAAGSVCLGVWGFDLHTMLVGLLQNDIYQSAHAIGFNMLLWGYLFPNATGVAALESDIIWGKEITPLRKGLPALPY